jgi:cytosine/adenosine deaminase-related metal-dependent hydrolase
MHDGDDHVHSAKKDILIVDNIIKKVGSDISYPDDIEVIDCTNKIISPGFIDSHHHVWQTQLKGRHANEMLLDYIYTGLVQS